MNTNAAKQRKGRQTQGRRGRPFDKPFVSEGIYTNPRLVHSTLLLVGCNVQVQVRNSGLYEGIFKTMSPTGSVVLEMAHKIDPSSPQDAIPSRDMLINSLVFNLGDVVQITAAAVDLDYANKESSAELSLTKCNNGAAVEKELQPWEAEGQDAPLESLEKGSTSANGWDAEEMFNTNADKFDIKSSYDPNLSQYTTPLVKKDTKEYREREAQAARLAQEIEKSEEYNKRVALENGDGADEEMLFSAVHRPGEANNNGAKYLPPHLRKPHGRVVHKSGQTLPSGSQSPHNQSPSPHQQPSPVRNLPVSGGARQPQTSSQRVTGQTTPVQVSVTTPVLTGDDAENKNKEEKRLTERQERGKPPEQKKLTIKEQDKLLALKDFSNKFNLIDNEPKESGDRKPQPSPVQQQPAMQTAANHSQQAPLPSSSSSSLPPSSHLNAAQQSDHHHQQPQQSAPAAHVQPTPVITTAVPQNKSITTAVASAAGAVPIEKKEEGKRETEEEAKDKTNSTLNPNAKEFIPAAAKTYRQPVPVPTPPRGATQSPVIVQAPVYPAVPYIMTNPAPGQMMPNPQAARMAPAKKATVSAQAAAATGQPLLQTPNPQYSVQPFNLQMAPTAQGAAMSQVFTQGVVPLAHNMRMVTQQVMHGATTPTEQITFPQGQPPVFVHHNMNTVPSYMSGPPSGAGAAGSSQQAPQSHSVPSHMAPHHHATPPHSQTNHISQGATSVGHHNPSPVPQHNPANHLPLQQQGHHQPNSATPQPQHIVYQHGGQHNPQQGGPGHPPLQPSPHTPTSPQNIYPSMQYSQPYSIQPHMSYNTSAAPQQAIYTVTHSHHHQHPQLGVMQQQPAQQHNMHQNNPGVNPQMQQGAITAAPGAPQQHGPYQLNQLQQGHHLQGGPPLPGQAGPMNIMQQHMVQQNPQAYHHNQ